eukprot:TRINITY_DN7571_c0_g2_i1.p1 TRINITY_DN7571_c0_g2~~TRINITY_DN7571_c0_g2_i1.p1  ORF type:complete len:915 (+),score=200.84 TRINITY_DN7571_c0_g2_i1:61-2745(+)
MPAGSARSSSQEAAPRSPRNATDGPSTPTVQALSNMSFGTQVDIAAAREVKNLSFGCQADQPLQDTWTFWLAAPSYDGYTSTCSSSAGSLGSVPSVRSFWRFYNRLRPHELPQGSVLLLARERVEPFSGPIGDAHFEVRVPERSAFQRLWLDVCLAVVGSQVPDAHTCQACGCYVEESLVVLWVRGAGVGIRDTVGRHLQQLAPRNASIRYVEPGDAGEARPLPSTPPRTRSPASALAAELAGIAKPRKRRNSCPGAGDVGELLDIAQAQQQQQQQRQQQQTSTPPPPARRDPSFSASAPVILECDDSPRSDRVASALAGTSPANPRTARLADIGRSRTMTNVGGLPKPPGRLRGSSFRRSKSSGNLEMESDRTPGILPTTAFNNSVAGGFRWADDESELGASMLVRNVSVTSKLTQDVVRTPPNSPISPHDGCVPPVATRPDLVLPAGLQPPPQGDVYQHPAQQPYDYQYTGSPYQHQQDFFPPGPPQDAFGAPNSPHHAQPPSTFGMAAHTSPPGSPASAHAPPPLHHASPQISPDTLALTAVGPESPPALDMQPSPRHVDCLSGMDASGVDFGMPPQLVQGGEDSVRSGAVSPASVSGQVYQNAQSLLPTATALSAAGGVLPYQQAQAAAYQMQLAGGWPQTLLDQQQLQQQVMLQPGVMDGQGMPQTQFAFGDGMPRLVVSPVPGIPSAVPLGSPPVSMPQAEERRMPQEPNPEGWDVPLMLRYLEVRAGLAPIHTDPSIKHSKSRSPRNRRKIRERKIREAALQARRHMELLSPLFQCPPSTWISPLSNRLMPRPDGIEDETWFRFIQACRKDGVLPQVVATLEDDELERLGLEHPVERHAVRHGAVYSGADPNPLRELAEEMIRYPVSLPPLPAADAGMLCVPEADFM